MVEVKCLISVVGVARINLVRNGEVHGRVGMERELSKILDQRVFRRFCRTDKRMNSVWLE